MLEQKANFNLQRMHAITYDELSESSREFLFVLRAVSC